jgi:hypothetical protein
MNTPTGAPNIWVFRASCSSRPPVLTPYAYGAIEILAIVKAAAAIGLPELRWIDQGGSELGVAAGMAWRKP